jgi:4-alpha-glucanotransferase
MAIDVRDKLAGLLIPVFALRRDGDLGIGDTTCVKEAIDFLKRYEIGVLQLLPINETGGDNSPYNAISSISLDPVYIDTTPDAVPYIDREFFDLLLTEHEIEKLRTGAVHYPEVKHLKKVLLAHAFSNFEKDPKGAGEKFAAFKENNKDWLENYAIFRTIVAEHNGDARWTFWANELQSPESAKIWMANSERKDALLNECEFWSFVQFIAFEQWQEVKDYATKLQIALMGDIPFGVSRYSADVWGNKSLFDLEWAGGAPPETLFQGDPFVRNWGQNWGIPLYDWPQHRQQDFKWWRRRVEHVGKTMHYFRIDHVLGFFRIYAFPWIPERNSEFTALSHEEAKKLTGGLLPHFVPHDDYSAEENGPENCAQGKELLEMILKASGDIGIVAEDLGMVPDYVRPLLQELGIPGFYIPQFERKKEDETYKPVEKIPKLSLATYGTHDHQPVAAFYEEILKWWHGPDGHNGWLEAQRLMKFLGLEEGNPPQTFNGDLLKQLFKVLLTSPAWLVVLMITDLLGTKQRFNEPGIAGDYNWSQRLECPLTEFETRQPYKDYISAFRRYIEETGRSPDKKIAANVISSP